MHRRLPTLAAIAATLLLAFPATARAQSARDLFPNEVGNEWEYVLSGPGATSASTTKIEITRGSGSWRLVDGLLGTRWWLMSRTTPRVIAWNAQARRHGVAIDFGVGRLNTFTMNVENAEGATGATWEIVHDRGHVQTFAGRFSSCVVMRRRTQGQGSDDGLDMLAFAPGVGPVSMTWITPDGPFHARLKRARVGGVEHRESPDLPWALAGGFTSYDATLYGYFNVSPRSLPGMHDGELIERLRAYPSDPLLKRISQVRTTIWSELAWRIDPSNGRIPDIQGVWRHGEVTDPVTGRRYSVVHWQDIDDSSWSFYFIGETLYAAYFEN